MWHEKIEKTCLGGEHSIIYYTATAVSLCELCKPFQQSTVGKAETKKHKQNVAAEFTFTLFARTPCFTWHMRRKTNS